MKNKYATVVLCLIFFPSLLYIIGINLFADGMSPSQLDFVGRYTQIPLAVIPLVGAIFGIFTAKKWGLTKSLAGKATLFLSLSMLAWGLGMLCWLTYIFFLNQETVPYPSLGDFFFLFIQPFSFIGVLALGRVIGVQFGFRKKDGKLLLLFIPVVSAVVSYVLLYLVARGGTISIEANWMQTFFDYYYPIVTSIGLSLVAVIFALSRGFLGGKYRFIIYLLFIGLLFQYFGDFWYTYAINNETYFNGYWPDVLFTTGLFLISLATANITPEV